MEKLNGFAAWLSGGGGFSLAKSAQGVMTGGLVSMAAAPSCGAGDDGKGAKPKPAACGTACGAGDDGKGAKPKPAACGTACGAGDDGKGAKKPKPSACGSSCGAGDKK